MAGQAPLFFTPDLHREPGGIEYIGSIPPSGSEFSYNEDEFVALVLEIFHIFRQLCYLSESDIVYPPQDTGRHVLNTARLHGELHMSPRVISLLERLPYIVTAKWRQIQFYPDALLVNYLDDENLVQSRDPNPYLWGYRDREEPDSEYLQSDDVTLAFPWDGDGVTWILDTKANSIRTLHDICEAPESDFPAGHTLERPDEPKYYRNYPGFHATGILKRYIECLRSLHLIPLSDFISAPNDSISGFIVTKKLREEYGWPDNFRAEAWASDCEQVREEAQDEEDEAEQGRTGGPLEDVTGNWIRTHSAQT